MRATTHASTRARRRACRARGGGERGAGRHHVVDDRDAPARERRGSPANAPRTLRAPIRPRQRRLRWRIAGAHESRDQRDGRVARATRRAISLAWLKPRSRCRAGESGSATRASGGGRARRSMRGDQRASAERLGQSEPAAVLERVHQPVERERIDPRARSPRERRRPGEASAAEPRQAAPAARRRGHARTSGGNAALHEHAQERIAAGDRAHSAHVCGSSAPHCERDAIRTGLLHPGDRTRSRRCQIQRSINLTTSLSLRRHSCRQFSCGAKRCRPFSRSDDPAMTASTRPSAATPKPPTPRLRGAGPSTPSTALFDLPFNDLLYRAQDVHRAHHAPNDVQLSTLLSIKTGGCPEDCGYCPQAARYHTGVANEAMLAVARRGRRGAGGEGRRRDALLHGRRVARAEGARPRRRCSTWCAR